MEKNFFDYYSYSFFNPFSSSRARINYSLLQLINNKMNLNNLQVTKDEIVDWIVDYLKDNDIEIFNDDESRVTDLRSFAYDKIRYFIASKWLIEEFEGIKTTYQMDEGAIQILNVMQNIMNEESKPLEFSGFVYSIYSLLKNFDYDHSVQMIEQIYDRSKTLNTMLRGLNVSIKKYLTKLIRENETKPKEILNTIYFEYQKKVVLKAFKNFRESDNPSKYKNKILSKIDELNESKNFNKLVNKYIEVKCDNIKSEENIKEATNFYNEAFDYLRNQFEEIESYIEMLNHKNSNYLRTAQSRVTFLLNEDTDVEGRITNSLKGIEKMDEEFFNDSIFDLFSNGNLDEYSLYNPVNKRSKIHPKELEDIEEYDLSEINEYFDKMLKENDLSVSKINEFVDNNLKDKNELLVSEFEVKEFIDLLKILCISIYSENSNTIYKIERMNTKFNKLGYKMDDFKVKRR